MNNEEMNRNRNDFDFYMADRSEISHSMTQDEVKADISRKTAEAQQGVEDFRRKMIVESLIAKGIDPETIDIDKTIETNTIVKKKSLTSKEEIDLMLNDNSGKSVGTDYVKSSIVGFTLADALGVPVEFQSRDVMKINPLTDMMGYGTHRQPEGTWSDDSSMVLATLDSIIEKEKIDYNDIMKKYCDWALKANYTATDCVFDMGITTSNSIKRFLNENLSAEKCGDSGFKNNGNGSLMRVLPIALYLSNSNLSENEKTEIINNFSSITHQHEISRFGCKLYCDYVSELIKSGMNKEQALENITRKDYSSEYSSETLGMYERILNGSIKYAKEDDVRGSGYVLHTLEASLWAILQTDSYEDAVLKAINLGEDTDTVGAITGSLAGMIYGYENIPSKWLSKLKKRDYIEELSDKFSKVLFIDAMENENADDKNNVL